LNSLSRERALATAPYHHKPSIIMPSEHDPLLTQQSEPSEEEPSPQHHTRHTTWGRILAFFGIDEGIRPGERWVLVETLGYNTAEVYPGHSHALQGTNYLKIAATLALLVISSWHPSPVYPEVSEWRACNIPLGPWNLIMAVIRGAQAILVFWYLKGRTSRVMKKYVSTVLLFGRP